MLGRTLVSRALLLQNLKTAGNSFKQAKRNSGHGVWSYRVPPPQPSRRSILLAEGLGGIFWFWILWHCVTEPEHIIGEWTYIPPSTWTDEELGIPPDETGSLKK